MLSGVLLGLVGGAGLVLAVGRLPVLRRPTLDDRLAPYLRDTARPSRLLEPAGRTPFPTVERLLGPLLVTAGQRLDRAIGGAGSVRRRLAQAGRGTSVEGFRIEQLVWGTAGLAGAVGLSVLLVLRGVARSPLALLVLCGLAFVGGVLARDRALRREVTRREERMLAEFPTVAELLALSVTAGEGPLAALERVGRISGGELAAELRRTLAHARAGAPLAAALEDMARRTTLPALARFVDGLVVALERGTPLADVLRAQAVDVREAGKRALVEAGGRKEIAMLVPVVFLILPLTVIFALFPGFYGLSFSTP